ncbi:MAG: hypothetical protein RID09_06280 [Coleofasciculus sp. G1-WW12-02]|uniref:hypothetical protein n=1 Tax=Coleofasciculus sp. G1-WW12-02 TaxID=3068483 RepID=UPI0032F9CB1D
MVKGSGTGVLLGKTTLSELLLPITIRFPELIVILPPGLLPLPVTIGELRLRFPELIVILPPGLLPLPVTIGELRLRFPELIVILPPGLLPLPVTIGELRLRFPELIVILPPELLSLPVTIGGLTIISLVCGSILRFSVLTLIIAASEGRKKNKPHKLATKAKHNELFFDSKMLLIFDWLYYNYQNTFKLSDIE